MWTTHFFRCTKLCWFLADGIRSSSSALFEASVHPLLYMVFFHLFFSTSIAWVCGHFFVLGPDSRLCSKLLFLGFAPISVSSPNTHDLGRSCIIRLLVDYSQFPEPRILIFWIWSIIKFLFVCMLLGPYCRNRLVLCWDNFHCTHFTTSFSVCFLKTL